MISPDLEKELRARTHQLNEIYGSQEIKARDFALWIASEVGQLAFDVVNAQTLANPDSNYRAHLVGLAALCAVAVQHLDRYRKAANGQ